MLDYFEGDVHPCANTSNNKIFDKIEINIVSISNIDKYVD